MKINGSLFYGQLHKTFPNILEKTGKEKDYGLHKENSYDKITRCFTKDTSIQNKQFRKQKRLGTTTAAREFVLVVEIVSISIVLNKLLAGRKIAKKKEML